jgi:hypothetical protein
MYSAEEATAIKLEELDTDLKQLQKLLKDKKEDIANNNLAAGEDLLAPNPEVQGWLEVNQVQMAVWSKEKEIEDLQALHRLTDAH